jgi:hypothetical protein
MWLTDRIRAWFKTLRTWEGVRIVDAGVVAAIIGAISALAVVVLTAYLSLRSYPKQKKIDREEYRNQKDVDREHYADQKRIDREIELRDSRMKAYERYLKAFRGDTSLYDFGHVPAKDSPVKIKAVNEYWLAYSNLFQIAPDSVLLAVTEFHKLAWMEDTELRAEEFDREFKRLYARMIIEMRKDSFNKTEFETTDLEQNQHLVEERLPFAFSSKQSEEEHEAPRERNPSYPLPEDSQG